MSDPASMTDTVIGLDLSLTSTGVYTQAGDIVMGGVITPDELRGPARLHYICREICYTINKVGGVGLAVIEGYALGYGGKAQRGHFDRAELHGAVRHIFYQSRIDMLIVPPNSLKLFATLKGNAKKGVMMEAAREDGYDCHTDDDADAYFLWKMGCAKLSGRIRCAKRRQAMAGTELIRASKIANVCKID